MAVRFSVPGIITDGTPLGSKLSRRPDIFSTVGSEPERKQPGHGVRSSRGRQFDRSFMPDFSSAVPTAQAIEALRNFLSLLIISLPPKGKAPWLKFSPRKSSKAGIDLRSSDR